VNAAVESAMERQILLYRPSPERVRTWRLKAHQEAAKQAGFAYASYGHLKLVTIADELAAMIDLLAETADAAGNPTVRSAITHHFTASGFDEEEALRPNATHEGVVSFLRSHDLGFRIRRLRFLADRLTEIEAGEGDSDQMGLQAARDAIYLSLAPFLDLQIRDYYSSPVVGAARNAVADIETAIAAIGAARNLEALDIDTDARIAAALPLLSRIDRRTLLLAYLGFTFYDLATLALLRTQEKQEFHAIQVDRISPDDAGSIRSGGAVAMLKGIEFNLFGAFFSKAYRENDYLWGRLHGAERLIDIMLSTLPEGSGIAAEDVIQTKKAIFRAIIDEERERLTSVPDLIAEIEREIGAI
jgi:patatin-related protein